VFIHNFSVNDWLFVLLAVVMIVLRFAVAHPMGG
jgi:hypothetical protein